MDRSDLNNYPHRGGKHLRSNPERYFHVMAQGWFIFTREGIQGPFVDRPRAEAHLSSHLNELKGSQDPSASWRL